MKLRSARSPVAVCHLHHQYRLAEAATYAEERLRSYTGLSMTAESHPEVETLHLWQTGELESHQQREVQKHLDSCLACREMLAGFDALYSEAKWADTTVASRSMRAKLTSQTRRDRWIRLSWSGAVAAGLIVAVLLYTADFTPSARAETLLNHAMSHEAETPFRPQILLIKVWK